MKRLVSLAIAVVVGCVAFPLFAIAGLRGGSDPACYDPAGVPDPASQPVVTGLWDTEQITNTATLVEVGHTKGVPPWGWVIAVATAIQESRLRNLPHLGDANDHDSIGLFQQRPSQGWGTPEQLSDPTYQAGQFYDALLAVDGWQAMPLTEAAQAVQRSAYPQAYAQHTADAIQLVSQVGVSLGLSTVAVMPCVTVSAQGWTQPVHGPVVSGFGPRDGRLHAGTDIAAPRHTIIVAAASGTVTVVRCNAVDQDTGADWGCHRDGDPNRTAGCGWYVEISHPGEVVTRYCHLQTEPWVRVGDLAIVGQPIGTVGSTGRSSGPHLHYEVHLDGDRSNDGAIDAEAWMVMQGAPLGNSD
jgi:murein DD-endopeptidase MepM/ murein hydrolase activator NlpD